MLQLAARSLKVTLVVDADAIAGAKIPDGVGKVPFRALVAGRTITGSLNAKSVRRVVKTLDEGDCAVIVQGRLMAGDVLEGAGISAQPRAQKAT
jgi:hypothetical protein